MATPADLPEPGSPDPTVVFDDGLGVRRLERDETSGDLVEKLYVSLMLSKHAAALRERATRLANFRHPRFPRVRGVEVSDDQKIVVVVSDPVEGVRLSEVIAQSQQNRLGIEVHAALQVGREVLPALATLHGSRAVTHGTVAAERLVLTRTGRVVVSDHSLGAAIEKLQYPRPRLWKDFRIAMPPAAGMPRFDQRADVAQVALVMLELILGRPLTVSEFPEGLKALLGSVSERLGARTHRPLSSSLRAWFEQALPVDARKPLGSALDAQIALEEAVKRERAYAPDPGALRQLATRALQLVPAHAAPPEKAAPAPASTPLHVVAPEHPAAQDVEPAARPTPKRQGSRTQAPPRPTPEEEEADEIAFLERELARLAAEEQQASAPLAPAAAMVSLSDPTSDPLGMGGPIGDAVVEVISETPRFIETPAARSLDDSAAIDSSEFPESPLVVVEYDGALEAQPEPEPAWCLTPPEDGLRLDADAASARDDADAPHVDRDTLWLDFHTMHVSRQVAQAAEVAASHTGLAAAARPRSVAPLVARAVAPVTAGVCTTIGAIADAAKRYGAFAASDAPFDRAHDAAEPGAAWLLAARSVMADAAALAAIPAKAARPKARRLAKALTILPFVPATRRRRAPAVAALPESTLPATAPLALVAPGAIVDFTAFDDEAAAVFARATAVLASEAFTQLDTPVEEPEPAVVDVVESVGASIDDAVSTAALTTDDADVEIVPAIVDEATAVNAIAAVDDVAIDYVALVDAAIDAPALEDLVTSHVDDAIAAADAATDDAAEIGVVAVAGVPDATRASAEPVVADADAAPEAAPVADASVSPSVRLAEAVAQLRRLVDEACGPIGDVPHVEPIDIVAPVAAGESTEGAFAVPAEDAMPTAVVDEIGTTVAEPDGLDGAAVPTADAPGAHVASMATFAQGSDAAPVPEAAFDIDAVTVEPLAVEPSAPQIVADVEPVAAPADVEALVASFEPESVEIVLDTHAAMPADEASGGDVDAEAATVPTLVDDVVATPAASQPAAAALDEDDPEIIALLRELEELEAAEALEAATAREAAVAVAPETVAEPSAVVAAADAEDVPETSVSAESVEPGAAHVSEPVTAAATEDRNAETAAGEMATASVALVPEAAPVEIVPIAIAPAVVAPAAVAPLAFVPDVPDVPASEVAGARTRKPKRAKGPARKRAKREFPAPGTVVEAIQAQAVAPPQVVVHVEAPAVVPAAVVPVATPIPAPHAVTPTPGSYAPWEVPASSRDASAPALTSADVARSSRRSSFLDAPMPSLLVVQPPDAEQGTGTATPVAETPMPAPSMFAPTTPTVPLFESPSFTTSEHAVLSTAESVFDSESTSTPPTTKVHRFPVRFDPRHINWKRTLAASLLLMLLESAGFAAVYWLSQPKDIGYLNVRSSVEGLDVRIDGKASGQTPLAVELPAGRHTIEMSGYGLTKVVPVEIAAGVQTTQLVKWPRGQKVGTLQVASTPPGARVIIDGEMRGVTPVTIEGVPEGGHTLVLESDAGRVRQGVRVLANETTETTVGIFAGWLNVFAPVQVRVFEDGKLLGTSEDGKLLLAPGEHRLELINPQLGLRQQRTVEVTPGNTTTLSLDTPNGSLVIDAPDGTEVWIDGQQRGITPMAPLNTAVGTREVILRHPQIGQRRFTVQVGVKAPARAEFFTP